MASDRLLAEENGRGWSPRPRGSAADLRNGQIAAYLGDETIGHLGMAWYGLDGAGRRIADPAETTPLHLDIDAGWAGVDGVAAFLDAGRVGRGLFGGCGRRG